MSGHNYQPLGAKEPTVPGTLVPGLHGRSCASSAVAWMTR